MLNTSIVTELLREGVWVVIRVCGPMLLLSMTVGILLAIFQAVTQIHEQTLSFIFKVTVVVLVLMAAGGWMMELLLDFAKSLFEAMRSI